MSTAEPDKREAHEATTSEAAWSQPHVDGAGEGIDMSHKTDDLHFEAEFEYGSSEGKRSR